VVSAATPISIAGIFGDSRRDWLTAATLQAVGHAINRTLVSRLRRQLLGSAATLPFLPALLPEV
jgi:hypothetical protein